MFGERFQLNEQTIPVVEEIGRHMPGGFFIYRAEQPEELLYANRACFDIFGCDGLDDFKELTGFTFRGMLHPDDYAAIEASIDDQIATSDDNLDYVEYRIVRKDGAVRWVDDFGHYTETDAYGGIYYVFISDITEKRERRETDLATRSAVIEALSTAYHTVWLINDIETESFSLYRGDVAGSTTHATPIRDALQKMTYSTAKEYYIATMVAPIDRERLVAELSLDNLVRQLSERPRYSVTYLRQMEDGSERYFRIDFVKVAMPRDRVGIVCGFSDVDEATRRDHEHARELAEALKAAEEASKAKTAFLSNMSHEIRTPMNAIIGLDSIALTDPDISEQTRDRLEKIGASARHLLSLINDILDMSRIESGRMTINSERFCFPELLDQVNTIIREQCDDKGLVYTCRVGQPLGDYYEGDPIKLRQILINILGNAVKFTPAGGSVELEVSCVARLHGRATLRFVLRDTGIGMSEDYLPQLFEPFSQERVQAATQYGSTGLGMPITKTLVELMSGHIEVESELGVGTTFTVDVTLAEVDPGDAGEAVSAAGPELARGVDLSGRTVLLAEDMAINAEIMQMVLSVRGMRVELAVDGGQAVAMFAASEPGHYDAILMDMRMPVMDGLEATQAIRAMERADAHDVPIVALTANAFEEDVRRSMQAGLDAHLSKPVEPAILYETLERLVR